MPSTLSVNLLVPAGTVTPTVDACEAKATDLCAGRRRLIGRISGRADLDRLRTLPLNEPGLVSFQMQRRNGAFSTR